MNVYFLSLIRIGPFVELVIAKDLCLMEANIGGGHWLGWLASTSINWLGVLVVMDRESPGISILLVLRDTSGCLVVASLCVWCCEILLCCT